MDSLASPKYGEVNMRFETWNVRGLYSIVSLKRVARDLGKCKLDTVGLQEVR
jgi:exonuclease III